MQLAFFSACIYEDWLDLEQVEYTILGAGPWKQQAGRLAILARTVKVVDERMYTAKEAP